MLATLSKKKLYIFKLFLIKKFHVHHCFLPPSNLEKISIVCEEEKNNYHIYKVAELENNICVDRQNKLIYIYIYI